jgi:hypothetical protein
MPRRKEFRQMTDDELTDATIFRRVFPPAVRQALKRTVSELDKAAGKPRKSKKTGGKKR